LSITSIFDRSQDSDESVDGCWYVRRWLDVSNVKASPSSDAGSTANSNEQEILTFRASIESEDRVGDVIRASGWELDNYRSNPVVLWGHRHDLLPVGKSVDVWVEGDALMASIEFAPTDFAQQVKKLFTEGFLRGVSVGFRSLKSSRRPDGKPGTVFEQQELLALRDLVESDHDRKLRRIESDLRWTMTLVGAQFITLIGSAIATLAGG